MALRIKLKNSVVQDRVPTTSDLPEVGELAVNANINSIGGFMRASDNSVVKIFGPGSLSTPTATTSVSGISELATNSETTTGTATNRVVTPAGLNAVTVAERTTSNTNYVAKAGSTLTGVLTMPNGSNSAPAINFGDSDSGIFGGTNTVSLAAGGTTRLTADTGVSVVGTLAVTGAITSTSDLTVAEKVIHAGDTDTALRFPAANTVSVETSGSERARIDSAGRFLVGTSTARAVGGAGDSLLQIEGANAKSQISIIRNQASNAGPALSFGKTRGGSVGGTTVVQSGDKLGTIRFNGADGTDLVSDAASIVAEVDGTPGANDMPGRLVFSTTADGASSPTARMTIKADGQVGIGTSSPDVGNTAYKVVQVHSSSNNAYFKLSNDTTGSGSGDGVELSLSGSDGFLTNRESANLIFRTAATERMRIDSSGKLLVGANSTSATHTLQVQADANANAIAILGRSSDDIGELAFYQNDASSKLGEIQYRVSELSIRHREDGANILFSNTPVGGSLTERMRIDSSGTVRIANDSFTADTGADNLIVGSGLSGVNNGMTILNHSGQDGRICFGQPGDPDAGMIVYSHGSNLFDFHLEGQPRMRIKSDGNVGIGTSSPASLLHVSSSTTSYFRFQDLATETIGLIVRKNTTSTYTAINFKNGNGNSGNLTVSTGSVSLANSSDYRLKENETVISDGITKIKQLIPRRFNFKTEPSKTLDGFFAHEVSGVVPEAVFGEKDATIDEDGNGYQSLDPTKLIPILTAGLKEAIAKIETLETKVAALEAA